MAFDHHLFHDTTFIIPLLLLIASQFNFFPSFFSSYIFSPPFFSNLKACYLPTLFSLLHYLLYPSVYCCPLSTDQCTYLSFPHSLSHPISISLSHSLSPSPSLSLFFTLSLHFSLFSPLFSPLLPLFLPLFLPSLSPSLFCPSYFVSVVHSLSGNDGEGS